MLQDNTAEIIKDAFEARQELPMLRKSIDRLKLDILTRLALTKPSQDIERKNLVQSLQLSEKVLEYHMITINNGELASKKLDEIEKIGKKQIFGVSLP